MKRSNVVTEAKILDEIIAPRIGDLMPEAARSLLSFQFSRAAQRRIRALLRANSRAAITVEERLELEKYMRVGQLLDLLQAKARTTLSSKLSA